MSSPTDDFADIPEPIRRAFADRAYLSTPTVARLLGIGVGTLRRHQQAGHIRSQQKGLGQVRPRRDLTFLDVVQFIRARSEGRLQCADDCQKFFDARDRRIGNATLRSTVIDFKRASTGLGPNVTRRQRKRS